MPFNFTDINPHPPPSPKNKTTLDKPGTLATPVCNSRFDKIDTGDQIQKAAL